MEVITNSFQNQKSKEKKNEQIKHGQLQKLEVESGAMEERASSALLSSAKCFIYIKFILCYCFYNSGYDIYLLFIDMIYLHLLAIYDVIIFKRKI